jgi:uncharacterized protein
MIIWLALLFALVALAYASVGFGGGSTYNALLALSGIEYALIPVIALLCNIIVVTGGTIRYWQARLYDWRAIAPLIGFSAPAAFLGGMIPLDAAMFYLLLGSALLFSAAVMLVPTNSLSSRKISNPVLFALSAVTGLVAGLSGIGGGIFMAPLLHLVRWAVPLRIAAFASFYILINSIAGLFGQATKWKVSEIADPLAAYWPLLIAVLIGGQIGGIVGLRLFSAAILKNLTAILVGYVAVRLLWQSWSLF